MSGKTELSREKVLETIGVLALACLVVGHLMRHRPLAGKGFLVAATLLLATGLFVKPAGALIARAWLKFGGALGAVNSRIILGAIFYLFLTPIALLARLTRGDFLHLKKRAGADRSYWHARNHAYTAEDIGKLW
jgi:Saxitoxin biosynthesis operon protein SxtJ